VRRAAGSGNLLRVKVCCARSHRSIARRAGQIQHWRFLLVHRERQHQHCGGDIHEEILASLRTIYSAGMDPVELAEHVAMAIGKNQLYVIPYPEARASLQASFDAVLARLPPEDSDAEGVSKRKAAMAR
jgi:hypothetical protein